MGHKKAKIIGGIILGLLGLYLVGGIGATLVVTRIVVGHRGSSEEDVHRVEYRIYKQRQDYPLMANRTEETFPSGNNTLTGYRYRVANPKGLVLAAHGMNSLSDGPEVAYENLFLEQGYDVFAVDLTGCGKSTGDSMGSLSQSAYDVKAAYDHVKNDPLLQNANPILAGYSWGAYGVAISQDLGVKADKIIAFSAFNRPYDLMLDSAIHRVGWGAYLTVPPFALGTLMQQGQDAYKSAAEALERGSAKALIVQGKFDGVVSMNISLFMALDHTHPTTKYQFHINDATHDSPWLSSNARKYISEEITPKLAELSNKSKEEIDAFIADIDKEKSSALDAAMVEKVAALLNE